MAPCLPGAEITGHGEDGSYRGTFTVKLGPTTASYRGALAMDEVDEAAHRATMHATGTDKRGQGGANASIVSHAARGRRARPRSTSITDFTITGRLARFGRGGMIEDISNRLMRDFSRLPAEVDRGTAGRGLGGGRDRTGSAASRRQADRRLLPDDARALGPVQAAVPARALTHPRSSSRYSGSTECAIGDSR